MTEIDLEPLKNHPNASTIKNTLLNLLEEQDVGTPELQTVLTIVKYVIPVYPSLTRDVRRPLWELVSRSLLYLTHCVTFANTLSGLQEQIEIYRQFIVDTLQFQPSLLYNYIQQSKEATKLQVNTLKTLFFGSRLFNMLSPTVDILQYLQLLRVQWLYIVGQHSTDQDLGKKPKETKLYAELLVSQFMLHEVFNSSIMFDDLFFKNQEGFNFFREIVRDSPSILHRTLQRRYVLPYLDRLVTKDNYVIVALIINQIVEVHDIPGLEYILTLKSPYIQAILIIKLLNSESTVSKLDYSILIQRFGDINEQEDENTCRLFTMLLKYSGPPHTNNKIAHNADFLNAVTKRLSHEGNIVRERTMYIAKLATGGQLKYESDFEIEVPHVDPGKILSDTQLETIGIDFSLLHHIPGSNDTVVDADTPKGVDLKVQKLSLQDSDDSDNEEDDEDDDDFEDNSVIAERRRVNNIVFLKDLLEEYVEGSRGRFQKLIPLLKKSVKLVRQKKYFPSEVAYYAPLLFSNIVMLNNRLDEENFEQWRVNALTSILVVVPEKVESLYQVLFSADLSLQQRISLLYGVAFAARELRGIDDKDIVKPQYDFPTRRLPWDRQIDKESSGTLLEPLLALQEAKAIPNENISGGTVVWRSKRLELNDKKRANANVNNFRQHATAFFYPLANAWLNGIDLGTFDRLFKMHYLSTLQTIYTCAYPVHDYESMTALMERIMLDAIEQGIPVKPPAE